MGRLRQRHVQCLRRRRQPVQHVEIQDFHHGFDKIDVTQINSGDGGAGDFAFGGTVATAHGVWYTEGGGNTTLHFDTNGSTAATK